MTRRVPVVSRTTGIDRTRGLIYLSALLSLGHHVDHVLRGDHLGWPLTEPVTPFTYSIAVYPLILLGLYLSHIEKAGVGFWLLLSGFGALFLTAVHLGPAALEPPADIVGGYPTRLLGWAAFGWLLALLAVLAATFCYELRQWRRRRKQTLDDPPLPDHAVPAVTSARPCVRTSPAPVRR